MVINILAGDELYDQLSIPMHASPRAYIETILPRIEEDFGKGAMLVRDNEHTYHINVDKVKV
jgi:hypothetical protein